MFYVTEENKIREIIDRMSSQPILWMDTETADWQTPNPSLSLIQILDDPDDLNGDRAYLLDVLDRTELISEFIRRIMENPDIEKVFHNASYDLRFLGKEQAQNITCTLKIAKTLSLETLGTRDRKLKTLAAQLCNFSNVDCESGSSDWRRRPLSAQQLEYAKMDTVYLAQVHRRLLELSGQKSVQKTKEPKAFTATNIRIALECPRLFYLKHHFGGKTLFLPPDRTKGIGSIFHQLADDFMKLAKQEPVFTDLFRYPPQQLDPEAIATSLQQRFYEFGFFPYLQTTTAVHPEQGELLLQIWQGLTQLIHHWAKILVQNRSYCSVEELIAKTLIAGEFPLEHQFILPNGRPQKVVGKLDCLVRNLETKRLCVVEYKTYQPADPAAQLAQVAFYSDAIAEKKKVPVDAAIYCVLPTFKEYVYPWEQLQNSVRQLLPHKLQQMQSWIAWEPGYLDPPPPTPQLHLCEMCPQQEKCQRFFEDPPPPISDTRETKPPDPSAIGEHLVEVLRSFKVNVDYLDTAIGSAFIRVKLKPQLGVKVSSLLKLSDDLQVHMEIPAPPMIATQPGYVSVDLPRKDRQVAKFEDYIQPQETTEIAPVNIALGVDLDGTLIEASLSDPNTCHFLVGGTTGSGKSEFLRSLLLSLLHRHPPKHLKIALVDPKRVTFPEFETMPWLLTPVVKDSDRAIVLMEKLVLEMDRRYQRFERAKCNAIESYNRYLTQQQKPPIPRILCIFDEYADFMAEKDVRTTLEQDIKRLGSMARAAGIHLIIATQRPEANVVTPIIRSNLPGRIALRTASEADSAIILGGKQSEAAYLLGKGDLLYSGGTPLKRLQSLYAANVKNSFNLNPYKR